MNYAERINSRKDSRLGLTLVVILHVVLFYALQNGLGRRLVEAITSPMEVSLRLDFVCMSESQWLQDTDASAAPAPASHARRDIRRSCPSILLPSYFLYVVSPPSRGPHFTRGS